jgi:thiol-disulfide isomerase/thioredoxin
MSKNKKLFYLLVSAIILWPGNQDMAHANGLLMQKGQKAPSFEVQSLNGELLSSEKILKERKGLILNFWGLRCGSCIEEIPYINEIYRKYGKDIVVLGINVDGVERETLAQQIHKIGLDIAYSIVPDPDMKLLDSYKMNAAPLTVIVDRKGEIYYYHEGFTQGDERILEENIKMLFH